MPKAPAATSRRLTLTPQGCTLLLNRWRALKRTLDVRGVWDEPQRGLALDLLGVPAELRTPGTTEIDAPPGSDAESARAVAEAVVQREIGRLVARQSSGVLAEHEAREQRVTQRGLALDDTREGRLLARYETSASRRLQWALDRLEQRREGRARCVEASRQQAAQQERQREQQERLRIQQNELDRREALIKANALDFREQIGPEGMDSDGAADLDRADPGRSCSCTSSGGRRLTQTLSSAPTSASSPSPARSAVPPKENRRAPNKAPVRDPRGAEKSERQARRAGRKRRSKA